MKHTLRRTSAFVCAMTVMTASMAFGGMSASAVEPNILNNLISAENQPKIGSVTTGGESDYTITIPATLTVANAGWNVLDGGITAKGSLAEGKKLVVSAASENEWKLVANKGEENEAKVGYNLAATGDGTSVYSATATVPTWEFDTLTADGTSQAAGIIVEDYSEKPAGTYQDVVTFTATVETAVIPVTSVTLNKSTLELTAGGDTATLTATVLPADATDNTVTRSSDALGVATVVNGVVTPVAAGTATITATAGGKSATCAVTVKAATTKTITAGDYTFGYNEGETWADIIARDNRICVNHLNIGIADYDVDCVEITGSSNRWICNGSGSYGTRVRPTDPVDGTATYVVW